MKIYYTLLHVLDVGCQTQSPLARRDTPRPNSHSTVVHCAANPNGFISNDSFYLMRTYFYIMECFEAKTQNLSLEPYIPMYQCTL